MTEEVKTLIRCIGCKLPLGNAGEPPSEGALAHVRGCEKHPLAQELAALRGPQKRVYSCPYCPGTFRPTPSGPADTFECDGCGAFTVPGRRP